MAKGRPRAFDREDALDRAMEVFWSKGYEGASLCDLTSAMEINPPSLYAAFGSKEGLFRAVLDRYEARVNGLWRSALEAPTARGVAERLLRGIADWCADPQRPAGCLMVSSALACGDAAAPLHRELNGRREAATAALGRRLARARREGDLPHNADTAALAAYLVTVVRGMTVEAIGGADRRTLRKVAERALRAWPA